MIASRPIGNILLLLTILMLEISCASSYLAINPTTINYTGDIIPVGNDIEIKYQYNVFGLSRNERYAKFEERSIYKLIGMLISNQGYDTLYFSEDLVITDGNKVLFPLSLYEIEDRFTQAANRSYQYDDDSMLSFILTEDEATEVLADGKFMEEMDDYYLVDAAIPPGTTVSGLVALPIELNDSLYIWQRDNE